MKRIIIILLMLTLCFTVIAGTVPELKAEAAGNKTLQEEKQELAQLESQMKAIEKRLKEAQNKKSQIQSEQAGIGQQKLVVEENLSYIQESIEIEKNLINEYQVHIDTLTEELFQSQTKLEEYREIYGNILCYYYEYGEVSTIELLLKSKNISDFLTRLDYLSYIMEYNKTITLQINETTEKLDLLITDQQDAKSALDLHLISLEEKETELADEVVRLDNIYAELANGIPETDLVYKQTLNQMYELEKDILEANRNIQMMETFAEGSYSNIFDSAYWGSVRITSPLGNRTSPITGKTEWHTGIDFAAPAGTPIQAVKAGTVIKSEPYGGYGETVIIQHDDGTSTMYAHCSVRLVYLGAKVLQNQVIARVGTTGMSTGNHLHFSVIVGGEYKNPANYLNKNFLNSVNPLNINLRN